MFDLVPNISSNQLQVWQCYLKLLRLSRSSVALLAFVSSLRSPVHQRLVGSAAGSSTAADLSGDPCCFLRQSSSPAAALSRPVERDWKLLDAPLVAV